MRSTKVPGSIATLLVLALYACSTIQTGQAAHEHKFQEFVHRADYSHIWVTPDALAVGKPFAVLGEMSFSEAVTSDSIDEAKITEKLKTMAFAKWPDTIDAIINEKQSISADGSQMMITATAIRYE
jgi:hypothetical protein